MKKLLKLLVIVPVVLLSISIFASSSIATTEKEVVNSIREELAKGASNIEVTYKNSEPLTEGAGIAMFKEAIKDYEYLKNNYSRITFTANNENGNKVLRWIVTYRTTKEEEIVINNYVAQEGLKIQNATSDKAEQVKLVNKLVKNKNVYSESGISTGTAYGAITDGKVVCHGYTLLTERLLTHLGIENKIVVGYDKKGTKHSWNLVNIDNEWYHVDVTYNDTSKIVDDFLLKSDLFMASTRSWDYYGYPSAVEDYTKPVYYVKADSEIKTDVSPSNSTVEATALEPKVIEKESKPEIKTEVTVETKPEESKPSTWQSTFLEKALSYGIVPNYILNNNKTTITREEFVEIMMSIYFKFGNDVQTNKVFIDTDNINVLKAYELGITSGVSANSFSPNSIISREQAAVMIYRVIELRGKTYTVINNSITDINQVSNWAVSQVKFVNYVGIMNGVSKNTINPQGDLKKADAIALAVSTYEFIK